MRALLFISCSVALLPSFAQQKSDRFIEVLVTDTVRLPFTGMDYEVRMQNPFDLATQKMSDESNARFEKVIVDAEASAMATENRFLDLMKNNGFTYRLGETEHAQDYTNNSGKFFDVNTYFVSLKSGAEMEKYYKLTEGTTEFSGTPKEQHFGDPSAEAPRLMRKLYDHAKKEAVALVAVTDGHLGKVISMQEMPKNESSFLEQMMSMEKQYGKDDAMMAINSTHTSTMAFRFELLD